MQHIDLPENKPAILEASLVFLQAIKWVILENLFTTARMEFDLLAVGGNPRTKFMLMLVQGLLGTERGRYNQALVAFPLLC